MKDNFSKQSSLYALYRPHYSDELFTYILSFVKNKGTAWDCGAGNGQSALWLSGYFRKVIATDISQKQLENAAKADNIFYSVQPAEQTNIESNSIDLITVAQAIHWFEFEKFYAEVRRVSKPNALIAVWCYSLLRISNDIDIILDEFHYHFLANYWDAERKYIDDEYRNIPFPFKKINCPSFFIEKHWSLDELCGYLNTWSAIQKYMAAHHHNPVAELAEKIKSYWGNDEKRLMKFPIHLLLGHVYVSSPHH